MDKKITKIPGPSEEGKETPEEVHRWPELTDELSEAIIDELRRENLHLSLLNQQITQDNLYWKDQVKRLEKVVKAFEDEDSEKAKKLLKSPRWHSRNVADYKLEKWMYNEPLIAQAFSKHPNLENIIIYIRHSAPKYSYSVCRKICEELGMPLCQLYEPNYSHILSSSILTLSRRQYRKYLKGFVDCGHFEVFTRRKRDRKTYLYNIGSWGKFYEGDDGAKRPPPRIYCWNDRKRRPKIIAGFGAFKLKR